MPQPILIKQAYLQRNTHPQVPKRSQIQCKAFVKWDPFADLRFVVGAIMTVFALRFIYRRMTAVRKMVLLTMRDDLRSKGIDAPRRDRADTESDMSQDTVRP